MRLKEKVTFKNHVFTLITTCGYLLSLKGEIVVVVFHEKSVGHPGVDYMLISVCVPQLVQVRRWTSMIELGG